MTHPTDLATRCASVGMTTRQCEIIELMAEGLLVKEAAYRLGISPSTAKHHLEEARRRTGTRTNMEMLALLTLRRAA